MIACFDVDYRGEMAHVGGLVFEEWTDAEPFRAYQMVIDGIEDYVPGEFYRRELPCLIQLLDQMTEPISVVVIDGYAWLSEDKKGLGAYLHEAIRASVPIIGVAKNKFQRADTAVEVLRGDSEKPLFVSAAGISTELAADYIKKMHGDYRFPTMLKAVDQLARSW
jgi:deoxyribonuclease V